MKEWWINLSLREKQTVSLGMVALIFFLLYSIIWVPFDNKVDSLRTNISRNQKLLDWMRQADTRIQAVEKNSQVSSAPRTASLLTAVQKQINKTVLVSSLSQLRQADNDSVQMSFANVDFDKLISWLAQLWHEENIVVSQITVTATATPGLVGVDLVLSGA